MHIRAAFLLVTVTVAAPLPVAAQSETYLLGATTGFPARYWIHEVDAAGKSLGVFSTLQPNVVLGAGVMDADNKSMISIGYNASTNYSYGIYRIDSTGRTTLLVDTQKAIPQAVVYDHDGDALVLRADIRRHYPSTIYATALYRMNSNQLTLLQTLGFAMFGAATVDINSGLLMVRGTTGNQYPPPTGYFIVDPSTGAITTIGLHTGRADLYTSAYNIPQLNAESASYFDSIHDFRATPNWHVLRIDQTGIRTMSTLAAPLYNFVEADPTAFPVRYRGVGSTNWTDLHHLDRFGAVVGTSPLPTQLGRFGGLMRYRSRHLAWKRVARPNDRILRLSFPGHGGKAYLVAFSLTGYHPGITFPDGRTASVVFDPLTWMTLTGGIPGVAERTVGTLDANGEATVRLNANAFGTAVSGVRVWGAVAVLDATAPWGISHVVGPTIAVME